jgi:hypothetical protein
MSNQDNIISQYSNKISSLEDKFRHSKDEQETINIFGELNSLAGSIQCEMNKLQNITNRIEYLRKNVHDKMVKDANKK